MSNRRTILTSFAAITVLAGLSACGAPTASPAEESASSGADAKLDIAFVPKQVNNPVFDTIATGGEEAAEELGGTFKQVGASTATGPAQIPFLQTLTQQRVGAIAVSASDPDAIAPALKTAMDQGITVIGYDSPPAEGARNAFVSQVDTAGVGKKLAELACQDVEGCTGQIAILSATSTSPVQNGWIEAMQAELASDPEYAGLEVAKIAYGNDDPQESTTQTQGLLQSFPDLKGIVSPTSVGIVSAAQVLSQTGKAGQIALTGLATPNSMRKYVKDGTVQNFALWNLEDLGYLTYYVSALTLRGEITGKEGETFTAGRLGDYTIGKDGEIVLGEPFVYTKENIDDFDF